jgi:hypothetical protein
MKVGKIQKVIKGAILHHDFTSMGEGWQIGIEGVEIVRETIKLTYTGCGKNAGKPPRKFAIKIQDVSNQSHRHSWTWHGRGMKCARCGAVKAEGEIYQGECRMRTSKGARK